MSQTEPAERDYHEDTLLFDDQTVTIWRSGRKETIVLVEIEETVLIKVPVW